MAAARISPCIVNPWKFGWIWETVMVMVIVIYGELILEEWYWELFCKEYQQLIKIGSHTSFQFPRSSMSTAIVHRANCQDFPRSCTMLSVDVEGQIQRTKDPNLERLQDLDYSEYLCWFVQPECMVFSNPFRLKHSQTTQTRSNCSKSSTCNLHFFCCSMQPNWITPPPSLRQLHDTRPTC